MATENKIVSLLPARVQHAARTVIANISNWFGPLQPLRPFAPKEVAGRQRDYQVGENMVIRTRESGRPSTTLLRAFAENCDILRIIIETRKDQIEGLEWEIVPSDPDKIDDADDDPKVKELTAFFKRPDKRNRWGTWLRMLAEDMFVVDAMAIYKRRDRIGRLYSLEPMDGTLIKVLNDGDGRVPLYPDPSYQQILKGMTAVDYDTSEILYAPRNLRTWSAYGLSVVEQILITIETQLNRTKFNANYYVDGNLPAGLIFMDSELTVEQIEAYTKFLDASLSGNLSDRRKALPVPGARGKWQEIKEPPFKDEYDEWLARIICYAFSISPQPFVKQMNRATSETAQNTATEEGLGPITQWIEGWMNCVLEDEFQTTDYIFQFKDQKEMDQEVAAKIRRSDVDGDIITVDEARMEMGLDPLGGNAGMLKSERPQPDPLTGLMPGEKAGKPGEKKPGETDPKKKLEKARVSKKKSLYH